MTNHDPLIGKTLRGEYVIEAILGEGGMGAVYRAKQISLDRIVAVKIMHPYIAKEKGFIDRFNREAQTSARLEHPNIVPIYDYGQEDGYVYLVMRLLTGGSLSERLATDNRLPSLADVAHIVKQIAGALDYAHNKGVIHRDMKPSNIMFDDNGTPYLVDFGIAKLVTANTGLTGTGMAMGTPNFMPPEQWRGDTITASADQYALGVIVYNILTGKLPFEGDTPFVLMHKHLNEYPTPLTKYRADLPPSLMNILLQALAKDANARFNSCSQFANALEMITQGGEYGAQTNVFVSPTPKTPVQKQHTPLSNTSSKNPRGIWIGVVGIIALLVIGALIALLADGGAGDDDIADTSATNTVSAVVILITDTASPVVELSPTDTLSPTPSSTSTETPTPDILTAIAYIDETNTAQAPLNLTATAQAQLVTPTTDFTATIDAIMANRTATQQIAESIATNLAQKATDQAITDMTATQNAEGNIAEQSNADLLATQAALDRIATEIAQDQTATATLWTLTPSITPTATPTYTPTYTPTPTVTATFTPTAIPSDAILGRVNVRGGLNMRREPNSTAEIVFLIPENTVLILTQRDANSEWVYGSFPTEAGLMEGWVFAEYVTITDAIGNPVNIDNFPPITQQSTSERLLFRISQEESQASFQIYEEVAGVPSDTTGTTNQVAGDIVVDLSNPNRSQIGEIVINVRTLATDNTLRDRAIRSQILQSSRDEYEFARFVPTDLSGLPITPVSVGDTISFSVTGDLTLVEVTRPVTFQMTVTLESSSRLIGTGGATIRYDDFNLRIPAVPTVTNVGDEVELTIDFVALLVPTSDDVATLTALASTPEPIVQSEITLTLAVEQTATYEAITGSGEDFDFTPILLREAVAVGATIEIEMLLRLPSVGSQQPISGQWQLRTRGQLPIGDPITISILVADF